MAAPSLLMPRPLAARLGNETVEILRRGSYRTSEGCQVEISDLVRSARERTVSYPADQELPAVAAVMDGHPPSYRVLNATTLDVARQMAGDGLDPAVLNFASATSPGGGFLSGARAQEESLARSSGLYACLEGDPFYAHHNGPGYHEGFYSHAAIYSPGAPVFRLDDGALLDRPWPCTFLTCAAVMAHRVREAGHPESAIEATMAARTRRVLEIFRHHGHRHLLLGAWGCGAFGGDSRVMARLFQEALEGEFLGSFDTVSFAILDWSDERRFIGPFLERFGS